jgi:hypothetical protein
MTTALEVTGVSFINYKSDGRLDGGNAFESVLGSGTADGSVSFDIRKDVDNGLDPLISAFDANKTYTITIVED